MTLFSKTAILLTPKINRTTGNMHDPLLNYNYDFSFKNNYITMEDMQVNVDQGSINYLKGVILKKIRVKDTIIIKLLDARNFIDRFKM